eukprot:CAMPEP_0184550580 /NCGR_PEP_ID=MMETSP0199_2-20130426/20875_1 /TAXON_ID=1112570 /ORGANISM="Thraustochytrium sp., Strain LLF1b" /LENGTH=374 /DNA_ID=CAMNT_0026945493 /DNA_START=72 /DNA_END=1193 /DNA_ORIENTATION=-
MAEATEKTENVAPEVAPEAAPDAENVATEAPATNTGEVEKSTEETKEESAQQEQPAEPLEKEQLEKVTKQLEFYLSDGNLRRDPFLQTQLEENDQHVAIAVLLTFNLLKRLTTNPADIVAAVEASSKLELNETKDMIKRKLPFEKKEGDDEKAIKASIFAAGFPSDATIEMCRKPFVDLVGADNVVFVKMRRNKRGFQGSVFVEFIDEATAKSVLQKKEELKTGDKLLEDVQPMNEWVTKELARQATEDKPEELEKGLMVKVEGLAEDLEWMVIKNLAAGGKDNVRERIRYVELDKETKSAMIRFKSPEFATEGIALLEKAEEAEIGGTKPSAIRLLEGEEEQQAWDANEAKRKESRKRAGPSNNKNQRRQNGG